ncbi:MAG: PAS domain S-box protein, partial [Desulfosalsimonas sp.]
MGAKPTYEELKARVRDLENQVAQLRQNQTRAPDVPEKEPDFRELFENAPVGIFQTTSQGRANFINPQMARFLGGTYPEEVVPLYTDLSRQLYADPARRAEFLQIIAEKGEVQGFEYEAICMDGTRKWFSMNARVSRRFNDGTFVIDGFVLDITELKNTQLALQKSRHLLEETQQISKVGGWEYHAETGFLAWTDEVYRIYEVSRDQHDPADIAGDLSFYAEEDSQAVQEAFSRALNEAIPYDLQVRLVTGTGRTIWVRTTGKPEQAEDGRVVRIYGNIMDITEQKEAEEKHRQLEEQLQHAQKMEAVGRLAGGIAHDFNNLLSVITGYSEILLDEIREDHSHYLPLEQIQNAASRARDLVRQLLAFSRKQVLEIRSLDINQVITGFESFISRVIGEDIDLHLNLSDAALFV